MIKRILAFIILGFFITFKCLTWVPTAAISGVPAIDALYYTILQTLGMSLTNGVDLDLADAIAETRENIPDYLQQPDIALKYLLRNYAGKAWDVITFNIDNSTLFEDVSLAETAAIGLANASGVSTSNLLDLIKQWNNKVLDNDVDIVTPINVDTVAYWNKYNNLYINEYLSRINYIDSDIDIPPSLYPYTSYITIGNTWNYFVNPVTGGSGNRYGFNFITNMYLKPNVSLVFRPNNSADNLNILDYLNNGSEIGILYAYNLDSVNFYCFINSNTHSINFPDVSLMNWKHDEYNTNGQVGCYRNINNSEPIIAQFGGSYSKPLSFSFNSNEDAFLWYSKYCVNCPLLYGDSIENAVYISAGGLNISGDFSATVPNGIIDANTDDGKIVSNPIYWVVDENTGNPIDSQINLDKLVDYLKGIIDGTNSDTSVDFGDLVDAGVIEKTDGSTITDADVGTRSIADVIADATARTGDISITGEIVGVIPPLPILPTFSPSSNGDPTAGFRGMSVLARIVNVTNRGLPDDLIAMFYGIVACLIVLGLIKVLHK